MTIILSQHAKNYVVLSQMDVTNAQIGNHPNTTQDLPIIEFQQLRFSNFVNSRKLNSSNKS